MSVWKHCRILLMLVVFMAISRSAVPSSAFCGGLIEVNGTGYLESPNYPGLYQPNIRCVWLLSAPQNYHVELKFHSFDLENQLTCSYDRVEIRNGESLNSTHIGVFCGNTIPPTIRSKASKLLLIFASDFFNQRTGFSAAFRKV